MPSFPLGLRVRDNTKKFMVQPHEGDDLLSAFHLQYGRSTYVLRGKLAAVGIVVSIYNSS